MTNTKKKKPFQKKDKEEDKPTKRVPRPIGATSLSQQARDPNTPQKQQQRRNKLINLYLDQYLMNNLIYKDRNTKQLKTLNLNQLAYLLQISTTELMIRLSRQVAKIGNLFEDNKGQIARAIFLRTLNSATETQALIGNQVQILSHAQGNRYVPFLTSELNKALANLIASHKPLTDLLKLFVGNTQTLPQSSADGTSEIPKNTGAYLTTDTAIKLLGESNSSIIYDSNELDAAQGRLGELPEVRANYQGGDWAKAPEYLTDGTVETLTQDAKRISREERREQRRQIGEVLDDDDFVA